jgi:hypothetical protein
MNQDSMIMPTSNRTKQFPIGKKIFARYVDEYNDLQINFIPTYLVEDGESLYIGTKNDMVGSHKGYHPLNLLIGSNQLNAKNLSNIYLKKSGVTDAKGKDNNESN